MEMKVSVMAILCLKRRKNNEDIFLHKPEQMIGKGYVTFGLFKLIGGVAKGHPNDK